MMPKNRKLIIAFFIVVCTLGIIGIVMLLFNNNKLEEIGDNQTGKQFKARIIEVYSNGNFMVEPNENEKERESSDKISVTGEPDMQWEVGMQVVITYSGEIMLSYPARIIATDIQIDSDTE